MRATDTSPEVDESRATLVRRGRPSPQIGRLEETFVDLAFGLGEIDGMRPWAILRPVEI
jgi:hypothetical protein